MVSSSQSPGLGCELQSFRTSVTSDTVSRSAFRSGNSVLPGGSATSVKANTPEAASTAKLLYGKNGPDGLDDFDRASNHRSPTRQGLPNGFKKLVNTKSTNPPTSRDEPKAWTPLVLQTWFLSAFAVSLGALIVSLVILDVFDKKNKGLATTQTSLHYLWTYGPTFVLSLFAALWSQVEHRSKQLMPWAVLRRRTTPASETLLMDYISQSQPIALLESLKARHFPVAIAVTVSLLFKLLIVISTGLLSLQIQVQARKDTRLVSEDRFDAAAWNTSTNDSVPAIFGLSVSTLNVSYPPGTSSQYAVPTIRLEDSEQGLANLSIEAIAPAFQGSLDCEPATVSAYDIICNSKACESTMPELRFNSTSCLADNLTWPGGNYYVAQTSFFMFGFTFLAQCSNATSEEDRNRYIIAAGRLQIHDVQAENKVTLRRATNATAFICRGQHTIESTPISIDSSGSLLQVDPSGGGNTSDNGSFLSLSDWDMVERFQSSVSDASTVSTGLWNTMSDVLVDVDRDDAGANITIDGNVYFVQLDPFFTLYMVTQTPHTTGAFLDPQSLLESSNRLYSLVLAQIAKNYMMSPGVDHYLGTVFEDEQRLRVRDLALYWMIATLAVIIVLVVALNLCATRRVVSRDPGSIGGIATILARSPQLNTLLSHEGSSDIDRLRSVLRNHECRSVIERQTNLSRFTVDINSSGTGESAPAVIDNSVKAWWRPMAISAISKSLIILILLGLVVTLELLQQTSQKHQGLADVTNNDTRYAWLYIPGAVFLGCQTLLGMIDATSKIFSPFHELRLWPSNSRRTILNDELSRMTVGTLSNSIRYRRWGVFATALATLLAFPLTIVSSGLFTTITIQSSEHATYAIDNVIKFASEVESSVLNSNTIIGVTGAVVSMVLERNLDDPLWTHGGFALPQISFSPTKEAGNVSDMSVSTSNATLMVDLPSWHSALNCTYIPEDRRKVIFDIGEYRTDITVKLHGPRACDNLTYDLNQFGDKTPGTAYFGTKELAYSSPDCPYIVQTYGQLPHPNASSSSLDIMTCAAVLQQTDATVTLELPSYRPISVVPKSNASQLLFQNQTDKRAPVFRDIGGVLASIWTDTHYANQTTPWLRGVLAQNPDYTMSDLMGQANAPKLADAFDRLWQTVYPQLADRGGRFPITEADDPATTPSRVNGTVFQKNRVRLHQSAVSTRILEVLLCLIALCICLSFWSMNTREVLPKCPCSIAATASLLAGSEMLGDDGSAADGGTVPEGAEWCSDEQLVKRGVFEGAMFSMGWWGNKGDAGRRFRIDIGRADWSR